ncbi:MAG: methyltransferase type 11 [SAR86 cluster bacterium]|uniref:Methyltransferase type 11 n=1 Tax=SAR86 cluster bacterium TaxID=2030880 RepID=A0A2A5AYT6_9GAMM|nr:MAG: methyltransferase type 11 [SAR86 cluster bacterium]
MAFDEENASPEQLWEHYMGKYKNPNPIARMLTNGFFSCIENSLATLADDFSVLEVGCGPGESTKRIHQLLKNQHFEASEFEQRLVDLHLQKGFPVPLSQESVYEMHRSDNEFDCVLLLEVLEHLDDVETALKEIFRVARHTVILSVPNEPLWRILNFMRGKYWSDWGNTPGHLNHWSRREFIKLVGNFGDIVSIYSPTPWTIIQVKVKP